MINTGKYNNLRVVKKVAHGYYLEGDEVWDDILLPNKYAPKGLKVGDDIDVFIYFDSEDLIIATTLKPYATVGEFATLKVSEVTDFGLFLNWGLEKDLFVPLREQIFKMVVGESYVVYIYVDSSDRLAATTRLNKHIDTTPGQFTAGQAVDLLLYQETDMGIKAIVNGTHSGLIFKDDIINNLKLGHKIKGFIKNVRDDGKLDLSLREGEAETRDELSELIIQKLKEAGGELNINSKSSAETINAMFNASRKKFKIALGHLYKQKIISTDDSGTKLL